MMNELLVFVVLLILVLLIGNLIFGDKIVSILVLVSSLIMIYDFMRQHYNHGEFIDNFSGGLKRLKNAVIVEPFVSMPRSDEAIVADPRLQGHDATEGVMSRVWHNLEKNSTATHIKLPTTLEVDPANSATFIAADKRYAASLKPSAKGFVYMDDLLSAQTKKRNERAMRAEKSRSLSGPAVARNVPHTFDDGDWMNRPMQSMFFQA
jgi:hypothetical protein